MGVFVKDIYLLKFEKTCYSLTALLSSWYFVSTKYFILYLTQEIFLDQPKFLHFYFYQRIYANILSGNQYTSLIAFLEKLRIQLDEMGYGGAILMDLSKDLETLNHDLFNAELHAYVFNKSALMLIKSYLSTEYRYSSSP